MFNITDNIKILHVLQWKLTDVESSLPMIAGQGFNAIQISPIQGTKDSGYEYWKLYQPTNLRIGNPQIGTKKDLISLCKAADKLGIKVIVDIVVRHVAGDESNKLLPHKSVDPELLRFLGDPVDCDDYNDRWKSTHRCTGMPMIDYENPEYIAKVEDFLDELVSCGVWGFRLDQLKHYTLPSEGGHFLQHLTKYNIYGECIYCEQYILDQYADIMPVLTEGRPRNISKLIAKFESHDDFLHFKTTCRMTDSMRLDEWRVLVNQEFNSIYYARPFESLWKSPEMRFINTCR